MMILAKKLREVSFGSLMEVYAEGNAENGAERWPDEPSARQIALAEDDFYQYLAQVFFPTPGAFYAVWQINRKYVSALRLEPYQDGLLLEALETAPDARRRGYAATLIRAVQETAGDTKIYSHVSRRNLPSQRTHLACGFARVLPYAVCADGSVLPHMDTFCWEKVSVCA